MKPAETIYVVYAFINGRWTGILTTADKDHAEYMAADVIEGGGKAKVEEFGPRRAKSPPRG